MIKAIKASSLKLLLPLLCGLLISSTTVFAEDPVDNSAGLKNAVILIIRHAEKPDSGYELSPAGQERAKAYVNYFKNFTVDSQLLTLDYLFATADSKGSHRPRLTIEPFSKASGLAIDTRFADKQFQDLAKEIRSKPHGKHILICWHHQPIPELVRALGADPDRLFPDGKWPDDVFNWVIELRYGPDGRLLEAKRINENLMPGDSDKRALKSPAGRQA